MSGTKLECVHADTCFPDYWSGHHLPHVSILVWRGMTLEQIKTALHAEVNAGAFAGALWDSHLFDGYEPRNNDAWQAFHDAIENITPTNPEQTEFFLDLEQQEEDDISIYAYFVFVENY